MMIAVVLAVLAAPVDPDGVVTTAPSGRGAVVVGAVAPTPEARPDAAQASQVTSQDLTTEEQIDRWLSARAPEPKPFADEPSGDDRRMHGFVSGSIGTNDYSSVSIGVSLPIGENGRVDLAYSETKNGYGYPGYGYGYGAPYGRDIGYVVRPFGARDSHYGRTGRSRRSVALGFRWDEDDDQSDEAAPRWGRFGAGD